MSLIRIVTSDNFTVDYDKGTGMYCVSVNGPDYVTDCWFDAYKDKECVHHAKWIWKDFGDLHFTLCCSECLETEGARENANYCPNCGAIMDAE